MQILMTKAAAERVAGRVAAFAPDAEIVTAVSAEAYERAGHPLGSGLGHQDLHGFSLARV